MGRMVAAAATEAAVETETIASRPPPAKPAARRKITPRAIAVMLGGALLGGGIGFLGARYGAQFFVPLPGAKAWKLVTVASLPLLWLATVAFHELGHLVGGWAGGGRFLLYVVGPFMWRRSPAGVQFAWNRNVNLSGGLAACLPLDVARVTPRRTALMIAGGPLFSLVFAVACVWAAALFAAQPAGLVPGLLQHATVVAALVSFAVFVVTALPGTAGGFHSDGRRFLNLLRGGPGAEQENALMALTTASLGGVRPADYDAGLLQRALSRRDGSLFDLYAHLTAFHHAVDTRQFARAQELLDYVVAGEADLAPFMRDAVRCEYAWLLARHGGDAPAARTWLDSAGPLPFDPATRLRAEAAVLLAEGRRAEAAAKAREGLHAVEHKSLSPVKSAFAADLLNDILRHAGEAPAQA
jgi:hypothetical protein